jgi:putative transposase
VRSGALESERNGGISQRSRYANLGLSEVKELRQLRDENARLKRLVADPTLDKHILNEVVRKKI